MLLISLVSRRSRLRQGPRYIKRGSDETGQVANFAETEQVLITDNKSISSFVQIRGNSNNTNTIATTFNTN